MQFSEVFDVLEYLPILVCARKGSNILHDCPQLRKTEVTDEQGERFRGFNAEDFVSQRRVRTGCFQYETFYFRSAFTEPFRSSTAERNEFNYGFERA